MRDNGLSIAMFGLFVVFLVALSITGLYQNNHEHLTHGWETQSYIQYITSGSFIEAVFENWESEFLQMGALVVATIFLRQKGAADSKKIRGWSSVDKPSRSSVKNILYANSLSLALIALFILSFALHALGGLAQFNEEARMHGEQAVSLWGYVSSSQFWFESFQNWQSEFLAVGTLLVLSIFLRQQGSPESKPVNESDDATGK
jgi:hypothetical protein